MQDKFRHAWHLFRGGPLSLHGVGTHRHSYNKMPGHTDTHTHIAAVAYAPPFFLTHIAPHSLPPSPDIHTHTDRDAQATTSHHHYTTLAMTSSSSSPSSSSCKSSSRLKTDTTLLSSSTHITALQGPLLFPDPANECLCSLLPWRDLLSLSVASKAVKGDHDGKLQVAHLYLQSDHPVTSFFAFVKRHHNSLRRLHIHSPGLLPSLLICFDRGQFRLLKEVSLYGTIPLNCVSPLAGLLEEVALPVLEEFSMGYWQERGTVAAIMQALQTGACPLLKGLEVDLPILDTYEEEDGTEEVMVDEEQTQRDMEAIANALEARAAAGTCRGLQYLAGEWGHHGSLEVRTRLLRVLFPSAEGLPDVEWNLEFAMKEAGAPHLGHLRWARDLPPLVDALSSMISLQNLDLEKGSLSGVCFYSIIALIKEHKHNFLPSLKDLSLDDPFDNAADAKRFFENAGETKAFATVKKIMVASIGTGSNFLASAFAGGAFAGLEELCFDNVVWTGAGFADLCRALEGNPCANTLKRLYLRKCEIGAEGMEALGVLFAHGALPCLVSLTMIVHDIDDIGVTHLADGFRAASPSSALTRLSITSSKIGDSGLQALLTVIENRCLPALEWLFLNRNCLSDAGIVALLKTIHGKSSRRFEGDEARDNSLVGQGSLNSLPKTSKTRLA